MLHIKFNAQKSITTRISAVCTRLSFMVQGKETWTYGVDDMEKAITRFIVMAMKEGETVYVDIDGTVITNDSRPDQGKITLTPFGVWLRDNCRNISFLTLKGCRKEQLEALGFSVKEVIGFVTGMQKGLCADIGTKKVKYLIDNEIHEFSNQLLICTDQSRTVIEA